MLEPVPAWLRLKAKETLLVVQLFCFVLANEYHLIMPSFVLLFWY